MRVERSKLQSIDRSIWNSDIYSGSQQNVMIVSRYGNEFEYWSGQCIEWSDYVAGTFAAYAISRVRFNYHVILI